MPQYNDKKAKDQMTRRKDHYFWVLVWKKNYIHEKTHWRIFLFHSRSLKSVFIQSHFFSSLWSTFIFYDCNSSRYLIQPYTLCRTSSYLLVRIIIELSRKTVKCSYISDKISGTNFTNVTWTSCIQIYIILNTLC